MNTTLLIAEQDLTCDNCQLYEKPDIRRRCKITHSCGFFLESNMSESRFVKYTRPGQSWCSLVMAFIYIMNGGTDTTIARLLLALPWT